MDAADNCFAVHRLALARALSLFFFLVDEVLITIKWRDPLPVFGRLEIYGGSISPIIANWADTFLSGHRSSRLVFRITHYFFFEMYFVFGYIDFDILLRSII